MHRDFPSSWCLGDIEDMVSHKDSLNWIREHKRASPIPSHSPCRPGPHRNVWMEDLLGQFCWASSPCRPSRPGPSSRWWREMPRCGAAGCASVPLRTVTAREAANTNLCVLPWRWLVTTHPPEYLLRDEVDSPVLRSEVDLALQPGVGAHDEAWAVVGSVTRAFTVVGRASHGAGGWGGGRGLSRGEGGDTSRRRRREEGGRSNTPRATETWDSQTNKTRPKGQKMRQPKF